MTPHLPAGYPEHYEQPQRLMQVYATLTDAGLLRRVWLLPPRPATHTELLLAHNQEHIDMVRSALRLTAEFSNTCVGCRSTRAVSVHIHKQGFRRTDIACCCYVTPQQSHHYHSCVVYVGAAWCCAALCCTVL
jgi:acetoin utilization deacetylase AcuC-like enzyme